MPHIVTLAYSSHFDSDKGSHYNERPLYCKKIDKERKIYWVSEPLVQVKNHACSWNWRRERCWWRGTWSKRMFHWSSQKRRICYSIRPHVYIVCTVSTIQTNYFQNQECKASVNGLNFNIKSVFCSSKAWNKSRKISPNYLEKCNCTYDSYCTELLNSSFSQ